MKLLWSRRTHFQIVWSGFLVLPPIMMGAAVLITLSLMASGEMGSDEWLFIGAYIAICALAWGIRLYLNRFGWLRRWMHLDP